jgi:adenine-specific DNA-methyltransferase
MAKIEDLIAQIPDERLKKALREEVRELKKTKKFGLVFEEHLPETVRLPNLPVKVGELVAKKQDTGNHLWRVKSIKKKTATLERPLEGYRTPADEDIESPVDELVVVRSFGEPIYPALTLVDKVARGGPDKPWHVLINSDNFHALQLLLYAYEGKVDVIYIDPPYNTGARDWKYNNDYVDQNDPWRHSKWLSMLNRRLKLSKRLLNPQNSVLIITIDEKECHHLGMLLEREFPEARIQMVSSLINPANVARPGGFGRNDEYIFFVMLGSAAPQRTRLTRDWVSAKGRTHTGNIRWDLLRRSGTNTDPRRSPGCYYPIYIDPDGPKIAYVGDPIPVQQPAPDPSDPKFAVVLPVRKSKALGVWQWASDTFRKRLEQGRVRVTGNAQRGFVISILKDGEYAKITRNEFTVSGRRADGSLIVDDTDSDDVLAVPGSQWRVSSHDATQYGSRLVSAFIPDRKFPFPKSLYAVEDALRFFVHDKLNALVLDFFSGSGTTTHAVARLNKQDSGRRRSIAITNNEVSVEEAAALTTKGHQPGDPEWEMLGIFEHITRPRVKAALTGHTHKGAAVEGSYKFRDEFEMKQGFDENAAFFRLDFLDSDTVARGDAFQAILPILWMMAGCRGELDESKGSTAWLIPKQSPFAVLVREKEFPAFRKKLAERNDIEWVFLVTDSDDNFAAMRRALGRKYECRQLYKSYLDNFRINTRSTTNA